MGYQASQLGSSNDYESVLPALVQMGQPAGGMERQFVRQPLLLKLLDVWWFFLAHSLLVSGGEGVVYAPC